MKVSSPVEGAVIHEAIVQEVIKKIVLVTDLSSVEHIRRMELVHILKVILGRGEHVVIAHSFVTYQWQAKSELNKSVTHGAEQQR